MLLSELAMRAEPERRRSVLDRALIAAEAIGHDDFKAMALATLAERLEPEGQQSVLTRAIAVAETTGRDEAKGFRPFFNCGATRT